MTEIKFFYNESCSSNLVLLKKSFSGKLSWNFTSKIDSEIWKCPIFVGLFPIHFGSWQKNNHTGLISDKRRSFSWMCNLLLQSWMDSTKYIWIYIGIRTFLQDHCERAKLLFIDLHHTMVFYDNDSEKIHSTPNFSPKHRPDHTRTNQANEAGHHLAFCRMSI